MNGDVGMPYRAPVRTPLVVRIVWLCIGVTVYVVAAALVLRIVRTIAAFHGVGA